MIATAPYRPGGSLEIATALQPYAGTWGERTAAHLLRRAGFGGSPAEIARFAALPMTAAVDALVRFPSGELPAAPEGAELDFRALFMGNFGTRPDEETRKQYRRRLRDAFIGMQTWWLNRMLTTNAPLQEKMTLFWHGHFTSAALQKGIGPRDLFRQNQLFRAGALGNVRQLTLAVARDPAMLKYLDNATSQKSHPNENFARELMELFTLGIGNYTEQDIRESARAFTGWSVNRRTGDFAFNSFQHDDGAKTFLGKTGNFDGGDIVNIIFAQPAAGRWFARKLLGFFVYSDPEPELIDAVAALIRKNDYNLQPVMSLLLRSNLFYSERAYRALVKSPVEFVVGSYKALGLAEIVPSAVAALVRMGQILFYPPNVKGWDGGAAWLSTSTMLTRENFAGALLNAPQMMTSSWVMNAMPMNAAQAATRLVAGILQGDASPASVARLRAFLDGADASALGALSVENFEERIRGAAYLAMAMPAYQLN